MFSAPATRPAAAPCTDRARPTARSAAVRATTGAAIDRATGAVTPPVARGNARAPSSVPTEFTGPEPAVVRAVREAVLGALAAVEGPVLLAVSGGRDSMTLLDAAVAAAPARLAGVATFDHGTGPHARQAVRLVRHAARAVGLPVVAGRATLPDAGEAVWRRARWRFLRRAARRLGAASIAVAHTADDHLETVAMRVLRGAGPRGLSGLLHGRRDVLRPLLALDAALVADYAHVRALRWVEDPGNRSTRHLRNRMRHDLLPALERAQPGTRAWLADLARRSAAWRREVEAVAERVPVGRGADGSLVVALAPLGAYDAGALAVLWPALAARAGLALDHRGTRRLATFTTQVAAEAATGAAIQLAGGVEVVVARGARVEWGGDARLGVRSADRAGDRVLVLRRAVEPPVGAPSGAGLALGDGLAVAGWRFGRQADAELASCGASTDAASVGERSAFRATLPGGAALRVRAWRPGDRMCAAGARSARRVKHFLADTRVPGWARVGWPVVVAAWPDGEEEIVWIPGVRCGVSRRASALPTGAGEAWTATPPRRLARRLLLPTLLPESSFPPAARPLPSALP